MVYGYYQLINSESKWICDVFPIEWSAWLFAHGRFCPPQPTVFWRRNVSEKVGELNEKLHYCMDVDFYSRAIRSNLKFARIPKMLGRFRIHDESKTQNRDNDRKVYEEYKNVLSTHFMYTLKDEFVFELFQFRSRITKNIKQTFLKRF